MFAGIDSNVSLSIPSFPAAHTEMAPFSPTMFINVFRISDSSSLAPPQELLTATTLTPNCCALYI